MCHIPCWDSGDVYIALSSWGGDRCYNARAATRFMIALHCSPVVVPGCDTQLPLSPSQHSVGLCHTAGLGTSESWLPVWSSLTDAAKETGVLECHTLLCYYVTTLQHTQLMPVLYCMYWQCIHRVITRRHINILYTVWPLDTYIMKE